LTNRHSEKIELNKVTLVFALLLIISICLNLFQYSRLSNQTDTIVTISDEIEKLRPLESLRELTVDNPETRYLEGNKIVSGTTLHFLQDPISGRGSIDDDLAFYVAYTNVSLEIRFYLNPSEGYSQDLFLQKGNAYRNESGVLVSTHIYNMTAWQSPVIWTINARNGEKYSVLLNETGWYTLSLWSPILAEIRGPQKSGDVILRDNESLSYPKIIESWVEFKIIKDNEPVLFTVKRYH
jgi:hypothetical protein